MVELADIGASKIRAKGVQDRDLSWRIFMSEQRFTSEQLPVGMVLFITKTPMGIECSTVVRLTDPDEKILNAFQTLKEGMEYYISKYETCASSPTAEAAASNPVK